MAKKRVQRVMRTYYGDTQTHINEYLQKGWAVVCVNPIGADALEYVIEKSEEDTDGCDSDKDN